MTDLEQFMNKTGLSGSSIARTIGLSAATVSLIKTGKIETVSDKNIKAVDDFINNYQSRLGTADKQTIDNTSDLEMVQFVCNETMVNREMGVVVGTAGTGKTVAAKHFADTHPETVIIETVPMMSVKSLLTQILDQLGTKNSLGNAESLLYRCADLFKKSERILIIDEAENLTTKSLEAIRRIHDFSQVPVILVGTYALMQNLKGRNGELLQLYSRIANKWEMKGLSDDDRDQLFGDFGHLIKRYVKDFRRSSKIYKKAIRFSSLANEELNANHIQIAAQSVILD